VRLCRECGNEHRPKQQQCDDLGYIVGPPDALASLHEVEARLETSLRVVRRQIAQVERAQRPARTPMRANA
jgi:hypothetical protein